MATLHQTNNRIPDDLVAALCSLSNQDPWLLFQENYCKTKIMQQLLPTYSFYEASNDHKKYWLLSSGSPFKKVGKPPTNIPGQKPDLRVIGPQGHLACVELKVRPDFGASAQLGRKYIEADLIQLCTGSGHIFLLGASVAWWTKLSQKFPGLFPSQVHGTPTQTAQSLTLASSQYRLTCSAAHNTSGASMFAAWWLP